VAGGGVAVAGGGVAGGGAAGACVARIVGLISSILSANFRIVKRRHLTSLQAESLGLLGTPSSILWIRS